MKYLVIASLLLSSCAGHDTTMAQMTVERAACTQYPSSTHCLEAYKLAAKYEQEGNAKTALLFLAPLLVLGIAASLAPVPLPPIHH